MIAASRLAEALAHASGSHTLADIEVGIADGRFQLWEGEQSAVVTEIRQTPRQKIVQFFLAGGVMDELRAMLPGILDWARSEGCTRAEFVGRLGWQRTFLVQEGWKPGGVIMERDL